VGLLKSRSWLGLAVAASAVVAKAKSVGWREFMNTGRCRMQKYVSKMRMQLGCGYLRVPIMGFKTGACVVVQRSAAGDDPVRQACVTCCRWNLQDFQTWKYGNHRARLGGAQRVLIKRTCTHFMYVSCLLSSVMFIHSRSIAYQTPLPARC
jgi:hypothetical protein